MIRIAILVNEFPPGPGGIGSHAYGLASYFAAKGSGVRVLTARRAGYDTDVYDQESPFKVERYMANSGFPLKLFINLLFLWRVRKSTTHVVLSGTSQLLLTPFIRLFCSAKILCVLHGHEPLMMMGAKRWWLRKATEASNYVVAVSEFSRGIAIQFGFPGTIRVIPNGIHFGARKQFARKHVSSPLKLITVGSVTPRKGQINVIHALPEIKASVGPVEYHMVGIPDMADSLVARAEELGVEDSIIIHGAVSDAERDILLKNSHIFLLLSENLANGDVEGFGIAVLEANCFGLPAIGSSGTGVQQAIKDGETGILVDAKNGRQVAAAVRAIVNGYSRFSERSIEWAREHDWNEIGNRYWQLLVA